MIVVDPNNPRGLVWLASYPKSGNTWMRIFLYHLMRQLQELPREENDLEHLDRASGYESLYVAIYEQLIGKPIERCTRREVAAVRLQAQAHMAREASGVALMKTHNLLGRIMGAQTINLQISAGHVYVLRDPRDVVISLADHHGSSIDRNIEIMEDSGHLTHNSKGSVFEVWGSWSEHVQSWTMIEDPAALVVRYEDMLADPLDQFTRITKHLRQPATDEQVQTAVELSTFKNLHEEEQEKGFKERSRHAERFFRVGKAGQWKDVLSAVQVRRIEDKHRDMMLKFGYLPS